MKEKKGCALTRVNDVFRRADKFRNFTYNLSWCDLIKFGTVLSKVIDLKIEEPKILDVGCGDNNIFSLFKRNYVHADYTGVDIDDKVVSTLHKKFASDKLRPEFLCHDASDILSAVDKKFDVVLLLDVIEHLSNKKSGKKLVEDCCSMLEDDGICIITTPNRIDDEIQYPKYHKYEYKKEELIAFFEEKNMNLIEVFGLDMKLKYDEVESDNHLFESIYGLRNVYKAAKQPENARALMYIVKGDHL